MKKLLFLYAILASFVSVVNAEVRWFDGTHPVTYCVEGKSAPVLSIALDMFASDMQQVTGKRAVAAKNATIQIFQLDQNRSVVSRMCSQGIPADKVKDSLDAFWLGVRNGKIIIAGNNGRGCAYGILELSRMAGVSPWVWWGDVVPQRQSQLTLSDGFSTFQSPSVAYRGIFINDEDWSLRNWASSTFDPNPIEGYMGPKTYKEIFKLLLRLRANTIWPAMHEGTTGFFIVKGNKEMADSCGILIGTSHCEPLLRNNVAEWDKNKRGAYNYITNRKQVRNYWIERVKEVKGSEEFFTIGMRGIHDGSMEGVKTSEEKLHGLQQVIDDQREILAKYYDKNVERVPQVFIPYKEVLEIYENGLRVPDDVTLMWCDDNYGYMTRLSDPEQQRRSGGGGVYYHLSYWGRPHDYLWLTTTQPGLIYNEMKAAYDHNCRKLWIVNVHDPKVAAYDLELFLDMAWNIDIVSPATIGHHLEKWLVTQFGAEVGHAIAPAMRELYRLNAIRRPEFMGWTQVELDKKKYPDGKSVPTTTEFSRKQAFERMNDFARIEATVDVYSQMIPKYRQDAYFAFVLYPVHASAAMTRKMFIDGEDYNLIQMLTEHYNTMNGGKWNGLMSAAPRDLPVFGDVKTKFNENPKPETCNFKQEHPDYIAKNAYQYDRSTGPCVIIDMLGHSMKAVALAKGSTLIYDFECPMEGDAILRTALIPTQPSNKGDLRYEVRIDDQAPVVVSLKEPYRSEQWKKNVLRCQALKQTPIHLTKGSHQLYIKALDDHIIVDQWMVDFNKDRHFYVIPVE